MAAAAPRISDQFDQYEFIGLVVPGVVVICGLSVLLRPGSVFSQFVEISIGGFGLIAITSYVVGHFLDFIGLGIELLVWGKAGMPTDRILRGTSSRLSNSLLSVIAQQMEKWMNEKITLPKEDMDGVSGKVVTRRVYSLVAASGRSFRVDAFARTYGLMRGLAAAFFLLALVAALGWNRMVEIDQQLELPSLWIAMGSFVCGVISIIRMRQFGWNYAVELFVQFVHIGPPGNA